MDISKDNTSTKTSFIIHNSFYEPIKSFSNVEMGKLFHAIFKHHLKEDFEDLDDKTNIAFEFFKNQFNFDNAKWEKTREARRSSGKKGGRPKNEDKAKKANAFSEKKSKANKAVNVNGNVNVNSNVNVNDIKKKASPSDEIIIILEDLNKRIKSEKGFSPLVQYNQNLIKARMSEGYTVEDFILVNKKKCEQWMNDSEMAQYLRPQTLYSNKFEGYLNQIEVKTVKQVNPKYQTADERRRENNKKVFEQSIQEIDNVYGTGGNASSEGVIGAEAQGNSGFFSQLCRELPQGDDG